MKFNSSISVKNIRTIYFDGVQTLKAHEPFNIRNKWTSVCHSLDFTNDKWSMAINGNSNMSSLSNYNGPLNSKFSDNVTTPMMIRVGHYYFDNKPILGKIVDFNVWDRFRLTDYLKRFNLRLKVSE